MLMDTFNGALTLNRNLLLAMRESPDVVRRGLLVVLLVGLLVGAVEGMRTVLSGFNVEATLAQTRAEFEESLDQMALSATTPEQRQVINLMRENLDPVLAITRDIIELPTPLPRSLSVLTQGLAVLVSTPLSYLSGLLLAVIFTHIAARWLGGTGSIQQMLGLGALSVAPHALDALAFIPVVGGAISLLAWFWGLVVLIVGTSVAQQLEIGRATTAVLFFPLIGLLLFGISCCLLFIALVAVAGGV
jgi:hypothetical protein